MRVILLYLSYDGTNFCGWQKQEHENQKEKVRTVQEVLERALEIIHKQKVSVQGSGRTDSGVHARYQAATFISPIESIPVENYVSAINSSLPSDVRIQSASIVPEGFNARFSAVSRTYRYFISCSKTPFAHQMPYIWSLRRFPDIAVLNDMASLLQGEMDCAAFCASGDKSLSTCRYIYHAGFFMEGDNLVFEICANAFLWKMVRSIVGTLIDYEFKGCGANEFKQLLESKNRSRAGQTAPASGLFLWNVSFSGSRVHP